ncbi:MAG: HlyD family efflux transporter periplasmic adaptor subunit [Terrimicrobiaceae bacterium]
MRWLTLMFPVALLLQGVTGFCASPVLVSQFAPASIATLRARDTGLCDEVSVQPGGKVNKGQIVARLDSYRQLYVFETTKRRVNNRSGLNIAQAELKEKEAALEEANYKHRRRQISDAELTRASVQVEVAKARLEMAKESLEQAKLDHELAAKALEDRYVRSPIAGRVVAVVKNEGERTQPGEAVVTVGDFSKLNADLPLSKEAASKLGAGGFMMIKTAADGPAVRALISSIAPAAKSPNGEKIAKLIFENPEESQDLSTDLLSPVGNRTPQATTATPAPTPRQGPI